MALRRTKAWGELLQRVNETFLTRRCYSPASYGEVQMLRRHIRDKSIVEPFPRLFAPGDAWEQLARLDQERYVIRGYAWAHPNAVFCSLSAAVMHGLPVSYSLLGTLHLYASSPSQRGGKRVEMRYRQHPSCVKIDGVSVASLVEATVDCLCACDFEDSLAIADGCLRIARADASYLQREVERLAHGCKGVEKARHVARWADGRAESGGESIARAVMIRAGLPPTDIQRAFDDPLEPRKSYRADFVFELTDGKTVLGEFDGRAKYEDEQLRAGSSTIDVLLKERQRESRLTLMDVRIVRFNWSDIRTPGRLEQMLAAAGVTRATLAKP